MKKLSTFLSLAIAATILSGCYVSPYAYHQYRGYGSQCPPPIKVEMDITKKKEEKKKEKPKCKPECKPCKPVCKPVYKPVCVY